MSSLSIRGHFFIQFSIWFFITIITKYCVVSSDSPIQIIVINSVYNNSTVVNGTNNFESFLGGLVNSLAGRSTTTAAPTLPPSPISSSSSRFPISALKTIPTTTTGATTQTPSRTRTQPTITPKPTVNPTQTQSTSTSLRFTWTTTEKFSTTTKSLPVKQSNDSKLISSYNNDHFGVTFSPYVRNDGLWMNDYTIEDIQKMLMVIQTKCSSVLTFEMGYYSNYYYSGPYNDNAPAKIATAAAQLNSQQQKAVLTISQGAYILTTSFSIARFPDLEAAFYSAQKANSIYPGTVSSITVFVQDPTSTEYLGLTETTAYYGTLLLQQYYSQANSQNLKLGVMVGFCEDILNSDESTMKRILLKGLMSTANYIICEMFPSTTYTWSFVSESDTTYNFDSIKSKFSLVKAAFESVAPSVEIILCTGIPASVSTANNWGYFPFYGYSHHNNGKVKHYWDAVERWSDENRQRVYMYQAFDTVERSQMGNVKSISNGYWKLSDSSNGKYIVKATQELVNISL